MASGHILLSVRKNRGEQNTPENLSNVGRAESLLCSPFCILYPWEIFVQRENWLTANKEVVILRKVGIHGIQAYFPSWRYLILANVHLAHYVWICAGKEKVQLCTGHLPPLCVVCSLRALWEKPLGPWRTRELMKYYYIHFIKDTEFKLASPAYVCLQFVTHIFFPEFLRYSLIFILWIVNTKIQVFVFL